MYQCARISVRCFAFSFMSESVRCAGLAPFVLVLRHRNTVGLAWFCFAQVETAAKPA